MGKNKGKKGILKEKVCETCLIYIPSSCVVPQLSKAERMVVTVSEIVRILIEAHEKGEDINLNRYVSNNNNNLLSVSLCVCACILGIILVCGYATLLRVCGHINLLILLFFSRLKGEVASKNGLSTQPRLVDIIAAVPPDYRKALLPKLKVYLQCIFNFSYQI